jgi:hypothetical protein
MTWMNAIKSRRHLVAGVVLSAFTLGAFAGPAAAEWRDHRDYHHGWGGGYYRAPPVVYGSPYYAPPPVVWGPGIGLNIHIR